MKHIISVATASVVVIGALLLVNEMVNAQGQPKFKTGDRVDFDVLETSNPENAMWKKATIIDLKTVTLSASIIQTSYIVQVDPLPGKVPDVYSIPVRLGDGPPNMPAPWQTIGYLRAAG